jgi:hypothetical protein
MKMTWFNNFLYNFPVSKFINIGLFIPKLFHAYGQTDGQTRFMNLPKLRNVKEIQPVLMPQKISVHGLMLSLNKRTAAHRFHR